MCVPGFQRQFFKLVSTCKWIRLQKFSCIPRTNTCKFKFVGTFVLLRIPHQMNTSSCSGFHKLFWIPPNFDADSTSLDADSAKFPVFGVIWAIQCCSYLSVESKTAKKYEKNGTVEASATVLFLGCYGIRLQSTKCAVWPRNLEKQYSLSKSLNFREIQFCIFENNNEWNDYLTN